MMKNERTSTHWRIGDIAPGIGLIVCLVSAHLGGVTGAAAADSPDSEAQAGPRAEDALPSEMFVVASESATVENGSMTFEKVSRQGVYFTNRNDRIPRHIILSEFIEMWRDGGDKTGPDPDAAPPALVILNSREANGVIVEMSDPRLADDALTVKAVIVAGNLARVLHDVKLYIDVVMEPPRPGNVRPIVRPRPSGPDA